MERMRTVFEDWLPDPLTVATWILKSFTTALDTLSLPRCSSSTTSAWGDCSDTTLLLSLAGPCSAPKMKPTRYYNRRLGVFQEGLLRISKRARTSTLRLLL